MLKLFSLFGYGCTTSNYSESILKAAIEHAIDRTDPWIRAVPGYKKKLRSAVIRALDHVEALVDDLPQPIILDQGSFASDPKLQTYFISFDNIQNIIGNDIILRNYLREREDPLPTVYAMTVMDKQEKRILGMELSGNSVMRDVPQVTVSFNAHHFIDPSENQDQTRLQIKQRALDHLLVLALRHISVVETDRATLKQYRTLLRSKHNLIRRCGLGFSTIPIDEHIEVADVEKSLDEIETGLTKLGGDDRVLEFHLDIVCDILTHPEKHLWSRKEKLIVDRMFIKQSVITNDAPEITLDMIDDSAGAEVVVSLVSLLNVMS